VVGYVSSDKGRGSLKSIKSRRYRAAASGTNREGREGGFARNVKKHQISYHTWARMGNGRFLRPMTWEPQNLTLDYAEIIGRRTFLECWRVRGPVTLEPWFQRGGRESAESKLAVPAV
jgi:hypothetical protein